MPIDRRYCFVSTTRCEQCSSGIPSYIPHALQVSCRLKNIYRLKNQKLLVSTIKDSTFQNCCFSQNGRHATAIAIHPYFTSLSLTRSTADWKIKDPFVYCFFGLGLPPRLPNGPKVEGNFRSVHVVTHVFPRAWASRIPYNNRQSILPLHASSFDNFDGTPLFQLSKYSLSCSSDFLTKAWCGGPKNCAGSGRPKLESHAYVVRYVLL